MKVITHYVVTFFVFDQTIDFEAFALCREAVYVLLPWNEVPFDIARYLLVAVDGDHTFGPGIFIQR